MSLTSALPVRRDQFDVVFVSEFLVERVRVIGFVADEAGGQFVEESAGENLFHKPVLGWRSALHRYGERKAVSSGDSDDLRALAATGRADAEAPFFPVSARSEISKASPEYLQLGFERFVRLVLA